MAKLGTVFVELLLDDKVYKKNLSEQLISTQTTAKGIEQSWKVLGQRSDDIYNAQRRSYENALTLIKNSHNATKQDIIRAEQAAADKIKRINEQQYGHQTTIIEGLKKNWIAASVAIGAAMVAASKAWNLADQAAKVEQQKVAFANLAASYKTSADQIISDLKRASAGTIDTMTMIEKAGTAMMMGIAPDKISKLMEIARATSKMTGQSVTEAFDNISLAVGRQSKMILDNLGIIVSAGDANEAYARELKKSASQLTDTERKTAFLNATVKAGEDLIKRLGTQNDTTRDKMDRLRATIADLKITMGEGLIRVGSGAMGVFQLTASAALALSSSIFKIIQGVDTLIAHLPFTDKSKWLASADEWKRSAEAAVASSVDLFQKAKNNFEVMKAQKGSIINAINRPIPGMNEESNQNTEALKKSTEEMEKIREKAYLKEMQLLEERDKEEKEYFENRKKLQEQATIQYERLMQRELLISLDPIERIKQAEQDKFNWLKQLQDDYLISEEEAANARVLIEKNSAKEIAEINQKQFEERLSQINEGFGALQSACLDIASVYEQGSESAKKWEEAARTMEIAQRAVAVVQAVAAIATQGLGDPYTAFVRIAAMAATMASLLATIGESVGGGGGSSSSVTAKYTSTALGSNEASQSASKSYELLKDSYSMQYERLTKIYGEMKDLNSSITGLVTSIVRTGGITAGMNIKTGTMESYFVANYMDKFMGGIGHLLGQKGGFIGKLEDFLSKPAMQIADWIVGGSTETKIKETGLSIGASSLADILAGGVDAQQYAKIKTTTEGGLFSSDKTKTSYAYQALDASVSGMLDKVFQSLGSSLISLSEAFGVDTEQALKYTFAETKLNLKGMTAEEMNTAISEYISTTADNAAQALFGNLLGKYQQLNEGLMETATRVLRNKEIIEDYVTKTNKAFTGTTDQIIGFTESLVDLGGTLDDLTDNIQTYINAFYSDAERQAMLAQDLMEAMGGNMPGSRSGFRAMVEGLDLTTEAGQRAYVTMMNLAGSFDEYFSYIEDEAEKALQAAEEARQKRIAEITSEFEFRKAALTDRYNQQLQAAQDRLSAITEIANKLTAARERMKVQDAIIEAANFRGAKSNLMRGVWNDDSLNTLTGINPGQYSSRQDYLRDYYDIYNQLSALEQDALSKKSAAERTIDWLKSQYEIDLQNLDLQRQQAESLVVIKQVCTRTNKGLQEFDDGGIASGPSSGYEARLHGTELVISPRKGYSATVKSNNEDVVNSINELKNEVRGILVSMNNTTQKSYDIIDNWNTIGLPVEQT